ncbi:MAG: hypothetical protein QOI34_855 [Verrucomicrobiota bacterium]
MMKNKLLLAALVAASVLLPTAGRADLVIHVGDQPYYSHGPRYWAGDWEMVWVPGHRAFDGRWIHGHYIRGEHRRHEAERHDDRHDEHRHHHDDDDR